MLYFLKGILYVFKGNSMHRVFFKQKHHPRSKWLLYIWKSSLLYKNLNNTILRHTLSQGLLCALKATVSKEHYTLLKGRICIHVCIYIYIYNVLLYIEKYYTVNYVIWTWYCIFQMMFSSPKEYWNNTIASVNFFHAAIKYCFQGMPRYWKHQWELLPFSGRTTKWLLPLWKEWHVFTKICGRHNGLFLKECYAHLRVLLQSHATLSHGNVAISVEECCMEVCHKFSRKVTFFLNDVLWKAFCCP